MKRLAIIFLVVAVQAIALSSAEDPKKPSKGVIEDVVDQVVLCISQKDVTKSANCLTDRSINMLIDKVDHRVRPVINNIVAYLSGKLKAAKDFATFANQMIAVLKDSLGESVTDLFENAKGLCAEKLKDILHKIIHGFLRSLGIMPSV